MIDVKSLGLRVIHWEYIKLDESITKADNYYQVKTVVKPATKIKNGLLIKSVVRLHKKEKVTLDLICEQIFLSDDIVLLSRQAIRQILEKATNDVKAKFNEKYHEATGLTGGIIFHTIKEQEIDHVITVLQS